MSTLSSDDWALESLSTTTIMPIQMSTLIAEPSIRVLGGTTYAIFCSIGIFLNMLLVMIMLGVCILIGQKFLWEGGGVFFIKYVFPLGVNIINLII